MRLELNKGFFYEIDDADYELVTAIRWRHVRIGRNDYAVTTLNNKTTYMHQVIVGPVEKGLEIDHRDGNGLNNRRSNLIVCTHAQNLANQKLSAASTSGYKGVTADNRPNVRFGWYAQTKYQGKRIYIGKYDTPEEAARAYDEKIFEFYGEHAMTNQKLGLL